MIDPGPDDARHLGAVADDAGEVVAVLLTHGHLDHSEGARRFAETIGAGCGRSTRRSCTATRACTTGDVVDVDGLEVHVVGTPGHTSDSLSFVLPEDDAVLTGDTVLGRGTTVVAHPDGALGAYLGSLRRLRDLASEQGLSTVLPGHGPVLDDALGALDYYLAHRAERLDQVGRRWRPARSTHGRRTPGLRRRRPSACGPRPSSASAPSSTTCASRAEDTPQRSVDKTSARPFR